MSTEKPLIVMRRDGVVPGGLLALALLAVAYATPALAAQSKPTKTKPTVSGSKADQRIIHVLNRLGYGPRPEDVEKVRQLGLSKYIDLQLHPELVDDSVVEQKISSFSELQMSDQEIAAKYKAFVNADQNAARLRRSIQKMTAEKASASGAGAEAMLTSPGAMPDQIKARRDAMADLMSTDPAMAKELQDARKDFVETAGPVGLLYQEFTAAKLIRATESQRQLQEVLVDFWSNHFNIDIRKAPCGVLKILDDRNVIRPHIFGKFRDLLEATAKSPAMLVYLDNYRSVADQAPAFLARRQQSIAAPGEAAPVPAQPKRPTLGLNENYAREIMELHTLGVNGGYTQKDVREVARCLTGWGIGFPDGNRQRLSRYGEAGEFQFHPRLHDDGEKVVLGHVIPAGGGIEDGERVLDILANSPATWRHISYQLCQRLVCDEPPTSLIQKCLDTWQKTSGDLREIVRTIVTSPEFYSSTSTRKKIKSPLEYAISSVRALNGTLDPSALVTNRQLARVANGLIRPPQGGGYLDMNTNTLLGQIGTMGQPLFQYQAPTGFTEDSRKWVSSGALISRLNFSLALTQGKIDGVLFDNPAEDAGAMDAETAINRLSAKILHGEMTASTRATLVNEAKAGSGVPLSPTTIAALLLGSPEFQRR